MIAESMSSPSTMKLSSISIGNSVNNFTGRVLQVDQHLRHEFNPLSNHRESEFTRILVKESHYSAATYIYLYDVWADKLEFLLYGDEISVLGPADIVYPCHAVVQSQLNFPISQYCISVSDQIKSSAFKVCKVCRVVQFMFIANARHSCLSEA